MYSPNKLSTRELVAVIFSQIISGLPLNMQSLFANNLLGPGAWGLGSCGMCCIC